MAKGGQPACSGRLFFLKPFGDNPISRLSLRSQLLSSLPPQFLFSWLRSLLAVMVDRRSDSENGSRAKRQKMDKSETDPKDNPYLAHMYADGNSNTGTDGTTDLHPAFGKMKRHQTTAALAKKVEDGDINPFNGQPFSSKYVSILQTRRDLPVHAQR